MQNLVWVYRGADCWMKELGDCFDAMDSSNFAVTLYVLQLEQRFEISVATRGAAQPQPGLSPSLRTECAL